MYENLVHSMKEKNIVEHELLQGLNSGEPFAIESDYWIKKREKLQDSLLND